jgi:hypothetical protein
VFQNEVLKNIFGRKPEEATGGWRKYKLRSFTLNTVRMEQSECRVCGKEAR